jgi:hypothetical protein
MWNVRQEARELRTGSTPTEPSGTASNTAQTVLMTMAPPVCSAPDDVAVNDAPKPEFEAPMLAPAVPPPARSTSTLAPLGSNRYKVQLTANQQLHDKLRQAQDLLRHELPDGNVADVVERALDLLIAERMKRRFGSARGQVPGPARDG